MFILFDKNRNPYAGGGGNIYGIFTTADKAKEHVKDVLGKDVDWTVPMETGIGLMLSLPLTEINFHIMPVPVDPSNALNLRWSQHFND